jgi:hypothetical protein
MKVQLKRGTPIEFSFEDGNGQLWEATIPPITVGQYRAAIALESETLRMEPTERMVKQAHVLCGEQHADFVNALDPEQLGECLQALVAAYAGYDPAAMLDTQRALKKKTLAELVLGLAAQNNCSETSTL